MQTPQTTPLAPYGSMNHLALVAKVGKAPPPPAPVVSTATRTVVRRVAAQ
jgi:hypothetical protein